MTRARGQSSRTLLDREFPYQVLVLDESVRGEMLDKVDAFHTERGLPTKNRSVRRDDGLWSLYCLAQREDAAAFRHLFGGQLFNRMPPTCFSLTTISMVGTGKLRSRLSLHWRGIRRFSFRTH